MLNHLFIYRIDLYFYHYKLAIEIDKNGHSDRNIDYEIKIQKGIEKELHLNFIRVDLDKEDFEIFKAINEIFRLMINQLKKTVINKTSTRFLWLEFKSDNKINSKTMKFVVKKVLPEYQ